LPIPKEHPWDKRDVLPNGLYSLSFNVVPTYIMYESVPEVDVPLNGTQLDQKLRMRSSIRGKLLRQLSEMTNISGGNDFEAPLSLTVNV
jgi:hypothetical protein